MLDGGALYQDLGDTQSNYTSIRAVVGLYYEKMRKYFSRWTFHRKNEKFCKIGDETWLSKIFFAESGWDAWAEVNSGARWLVADYMAPRRQGQVHTCHEIRDHKREIS